MWLTSWELQNNWRVLENLKIENILEVIVCY